jgi:hypothetical protein
MGMLTSERVEGLRRGKRGQQWGNKTVYRGPMGPISELFWRTPRKSRMSK